MKKRFTLIILTVCLALGASKAQLNYAYTEGKFLLKGKVVDIDTRKAIPLAGVLITNIGRGVNCDADGNFTLYVGKGDTLRFSSTGYIAKVLHVYDLDSTKYYTLEVSLVHDFIKLKDVVIYPFRDLDEFKKAFVDAKDVNKVLIPGIAPPKYSNITPKAKFYNPISFLYDRLKKKKVANPDFRP